MESQVGGKPYVSNQSRPLTSRGIFGGTAITEYVPFPINRVP